MTVSSLRPGDIIEVDKGGRRFHALLKERLAVAGGELLFEPLHRNISYRRCTSREVVGAWRADKATRQRVARCF